jgi:hypothetical protein
MLLKSSKTKNCINKGFCMIILQKPFLFILLCFDHLANLFDFLIDNLINALIIEN